MEVWLQILQCGNPGTASFRVQARTPATPTWLRFASPRVSVAGPLPILHDQAGHAAGFTEVAGDDASAERERLAGKQSIVGTDRLSIGLERRQVGANVIFMLAPERGLRGSAGISAEPASRCAKCRPNFTSVSIRNGGRALQLRPLSRATSPAILSDRLHQRPTGRLRHQSPPPENCR